MTFKYPYQDGYQKAQYLDTNVPILLPMNTSKLLGKQSVWNLRSGNTQQLQQPVKQLSIVLRNCCETFVHSAKTSQIMLYEFDNL